MHAAAFQVARASSTTTYGSSSASLGNFFGAVHKHDSPFVMSVSMYPGTMAFTRMPSGPSSAASERVKPA